MLAHAPLFNHLADPLNSAVEIEPVFAKSIKRVVKPPIL
jgi:hypothetical protein